MEVVVVVLEADVMIRIVMEEAVVGVGRDDDQWSWQ